MTAFFGFLQLFALVLLTFAGRFALVFLAFAAVALPVVAVTAVVDGVRRLPHHAR
jgi:hypothetical protein